MIVNPGDPLFLFGGLDRYGAAGSAGLPVVDRTSEDTLLLTAAHCVGALARCWDESSVVYTSSMRPPATVDRSRVGRTIRTEPQELVTECEVDAAVVKPGARVRLGRDGGRGRIKRVARELSPEDIGVVLFKRGLTTGDTRGECYEVDITRRLTIHRAPRHDVRYENLFAVVSDEGRFARPGDSGAAVIDEQDRVVGLVVGMDEEDDLTYCIPIKTILASLGVRL